MTSRVEMTSGNSRLSAVHPFTTASPDRLINLFRVVVLWSVLVAVCLGPIAQAGELSVENGSGSGSYAPGEVAYIFADPSDIIEPEDKMLEVVSPFTQKTIFDQWVGQTEMLQDPYSPRTSLVMPASDVSVSAVYKDVTPWGLPSVMSYFPTDHSGVIFFLHGADSCTWCLSIKPTAQYFMQQAVDRGYGIVIPEKFNMFESLWDDNIDPLANVDMRRVAEIRRDLISRGQMHDSDPVYLVGVSGGGYFASQFDEAAQELLDFPVESMVLMLSAGYTNRMTESRVPTLLALAENDTILDLQLGVTAHHTLLTRGVAAQMVLGTAAPITPNYFWSVNGLSALDSQEIVAAFASNGIIDAAGFQVANPRGSNWESLVPAPHNSPEIVTDMRQFMFQAYAEHSIMDSFVDRAFSFLENPVARIEFAPKITGFSPADGAAGELVTIQGEYLVVIDSVEFNGTPASFINVVGSEIVAYVPPGVTPGPIRVSNAAGVAVSDSDFGTLGTQIDSMEPVEGAVGTVVQFNGTGLSDIQSVTFNGQPAGFVEITARILTAVVPLGATTGPVVVSTGEGSFDTGNFDVYPPPNVTSMSTNRAKHGDVITLTGTDLAQIDSVTIENTSINAEAAFSIISNQRVEFIVPDGAPRWGIVRVHSPSGGDTAGNLRCTDC